VLVTWDFSVFNSTSLTSVMCHFILGAYATRCDFSQGPCDWTQSTEDDFNWLRRRGKCTKLMKDIVSGLTDSL